MLPWVSSTLWPILFRPVYAVGTGDTLGLTFLPIQPIRRLLWRILARNFRDYNTLHVIPVRLQKPIWVCCSIWIPSRNFRGFLSIGSTFPQIWVPRLPVEGSELSSAFWLASSGTNLFFSENQRHQYVSQLDDVGLYYFSQMSFMRLYQYLNLAEAFHDSAHVHRYSSNRCCCERNFLLLFFGAILSKHWVL